MPSQEKVAAHIYDDNTYNRYILYGVLSAEDIPFQLYEAYQESESESESEQPEPPIQPDTHEEAHPISGVHEEDPDDSTVNSDSAEIPPEEDPIIYDSDVSENEDEDSEDEDG